nr:MAG TPA: hypothetical protein [Caudoviricetes sp.]
MFPINTAVQYRKVNTAPAPILSPPFPHKCANIFNSQAYNNAILVNRQAKNANLLNFG